MREVTLPSGAVLQITPAAFAVSKALYQAVLADFRTVKVDAKMDLAAVCKELVCIGFSSEDVEKALWKCFERCNYTATVGPRAGATVKIDAQTFEPVELRDDYVKACMEVAKDNIGPFGKSLYALYQSALAQVASSQESKPETTTS